MEAKKSQLRRHMKRAIRKVKFLLSFNATRWIFSPTSETPRRLSFKTQHSLLDCTDQLNDVASPSWVTSRTSSFSGPVLSRTTSSVSTPTSAGDVDRQAEAFIANFYRHIQMERQVSLELQYCKGK